MTFTKITHALTGRGRYRVTVVGTPYGDLHLATARKREAKALEERFRLWNVVGVPEAIRALVAESPD